MRISPFTYQYIKMQSEKLEDPNRMFYSLQKLSDTLFEGIQNDNRELTPELYSMPEILINK